MTAQDYDLVVIGSGPAGQKAAINAAKRGKRVVVIERAGVRRRVSPQWHDSKQDRARCSSLSDRLQ
jgi:thioredoxin reductase